MALFAVGDRQLQHSRRRSQRVGGRQDGAAGGVRREERLHIDVHGLRRRPVENDVGGIATAVEQAPRLDVHRRAATLDHAEGGAVHTVDHDEIAGRAGTCEDALDAAADRAVSGHAEPRDAVRQRLGGVQHRRMLPGQCGLGDVGKALQRREREHGGQPGGTGHSGRPELLGRQSQLDETAPLTALFLRDADTGPSRIHESTDERCGVALVEPPTDHRGTGHVGEPVAQRLLVGDLLVRELPLHERQRLGMPRIRSATMLRWMNVEPPAMAVPRAW